MMTMALGLRLASAAVLAIGLAGCGGGGDSASTDAGASAKALAATGSPTADGGSVASTIVKLQRYRIDPTKVFVAGISSGGFAAVQMHVAHSSTFKGAAVYAGGVYWCAAAGGAATALTNCGGLTLPSNQASYNSTLTTSEVYLDAQSSLGTIDPATNLREQPVYLWSGTQDQVRQSARDGRPQLGISALWGQCSLRQCVSRRARLGIA